MTRYEVRAKWEGRISKTGQTYDDRADAIKAAREYFEFYSNELGFEWVQVIEITESEIDWQ